MPSPALKSDASAARLRFDHFELDEAEARLMCGNHDVFVDCEE